MLETLLKCVCLWCMIDQLAFSYTGTLFCYLVVCYIFFMLKTNILSLFVLFCRNGLRSYNHSVWRCHQISVWSRKDALMLHMILSSSILFLFIYLKTSLLKLAGSAINEDSLQLHYIYFLLISLGWTFAVSTSYQTESVVGRWRKVMGGGWTGQGLLSRVSFNLYYRSRQAALELCLLQSIR